ncbi:hypothetical protein Clacol_000186 [Clathrus columnatus]|uniref:Uncharacterized protein n=1 Tax=Clathrus columnatus TaxID=1419009 RepID=A0AAV4ZWB6_9AGAM|nr:hypothetical protein Clacol_000186 [Clathrus columnatus]
MVKHPSVSEVIAYPETDHPWSNEFAKLASEKVTIWREDDSLSNILKDPFNSFISGFYENWVTLWMAKAILGQVITAQWLSASTVFWYGMLYIAWHSSDILGQSAMLMLVLTAISVLTGFALV